MPLLETAAAVGAAAQGIGAIANPIFQGNMNRKNRRFAREQYAQQYQDQIDFWNRNNEYNHPSSQMARLREAGLNPHLVYGNGSVGNSSSAPSAPQQARWQGVAPQINAGNFVSSMMAYQDIKIKQAQTDILREQKTNLGIKNLSDALKLDTDKKTQAAVIQLMFDKQYNEGIKSDIMMSQASMRRIEAAAHNAIVNNRVAIGDLTTVLANEGIKGKQLDNKAKEIANAINGVISELRSNGQNPNDPTWQKMLVEMISSMIGTTPVKGAQKVGNALDPFGIGKSIFR